MPRSLVELVFKFNFSTYSKENNLHIYVPNASTFQRSGEVDAVEGIAPSDEKSGGSKGAIRGPQAASSSRQLTHSLPTTRYLIVSICANM